MSGQIDYFHELYTYYKIKQTKKNLQKYYHAPRLLTPPYCTYIQYVHVQCIGESKIGLQQDNLLYKD